VRVLRSTPFEATSRLAAATETLSMRSKKSGARAIPLDADTTSSPCAMPRASRTAFGAVISRARLEAPWAATDSTKASTLIIDVVTLPGETPTAGTRVVWMRARARGQ
jgi:hypothetical protein